MAGRHKKTRDLCKMRVFPCLLTSSEMDFYAAGAFCTITLKSPIAKKARLPCGGGLSPTLWRVEETN